MERRLSARLLFLSGMLVMVAAGCATPPGGTAYPSTQQPQLPETVPEPPAIVFTGAGEEWPPRPRDRTDVTIVPTSGRAGAFTEALEPQLRSAALADSRVRSALGERFSYIVAAEVEPDKTRPRAGESLPVRLTFYSYSNNVAVEVFMSGQAVETVRRREGYQPPEGPEEMETAIAMARRDERVRGVVQGLNATAILTERQRDQAGYGHRVLHVSFADPGADAPRYYALVDLTASTVLTAGPVAGY